MVERAGQTTMVAARYASISTALLATGTIIATALMPLLVKYVNRRTTLAICFSLMLVFLLFAFGYVYSLQGEAAVFVFMACTFFLGLGGANFAVYSFWLPEQYSTECRVSAFAFTTNVGRFAGAGLTFLVGSGVRYFGTLGRPVALTSIAFAIALALLPFGEETKGRPLPH
jgi:hypothetical protein